MLVSKLRTGATVRKSYDPAMAMQRLLRDHGDFFDRRRLEALLACTDLVGLRYQIAVLQGNLIELARRPPPSSRNPRPPPSTSAAENRSLQADKSPMTRESPPAKPAVLRYPTREYQSDRAFEHDTLISPASRQRTPAPALGVPWSGGV
jgi:hypothetical protein